MPSAVEFGVEQFDRRATPESDPLMATGDVRPIGRKETLKLPTSDYRPVESGLAQIDLQGAPRGNAG